MEVNPYQSPAAASKPDGVSDGPTRSSADRIWAVAVRAVLVLSAVGFALISLELLARLALVIAPGKAPSHNPAVMLAVLGAGIACTAWYLWKWNAKVAARQRRLEDRRSKSEASEFDRDGLLRP